MVNRYRAKNILEKLHEKGVDIADGLNDSKLNNIEEILGAKLPPDLRTLLEVGIPISINGNTDLFPQWHKHPQAEITKSQESIESAFIFDIENNDYWNESFGDKPDGIEDGKAQALEVIRSWPPLIRIYGHRYMPTEPSSSDNPILSVMQAGDTVYYGNNLVDYLIREFGIDIVKTDTTTPRRVPYWGDAFGL